MRFSSITPIVLTLAPSLVSAAGTLGFALGTKNPDGSCKTQKDYEADFDSISSNSQAKVVRGYAASDCNSAQNILPAAKTKGFQVILGIWYVGNRSMPLQPLYLISHADIFCDIIGPIRTRLTMLI
jgi:glucan 1,3-beta-glucosidase